jgi:hypothetical protein
MGFDFFGNKARKDIQNANNQANAALSEGYGQQQQRYDQAFDMYSPYAQQGQKANDFYTNALGLGGQEAQGQAIGTLTSNPLFSGQLAQDSNALSRQLNARGMGAGGTAAMAGQRVFQQTAANWLDRYRDAGQQGFQATGQQAGIRTAQGDNAYGYAGTRANQAVGYGNALSQTRNAGLNNLLNVAGTVISGANAMRKPPGMG